MFDKSLFVQSWKKRFSFDKYFIACSPRSLSYSYQGRLRLVTIFTICLSAFGGLTIVGQLITPPIVKICYFIKWKKKKNYCTKKISS